jgi:hypothetical protein
MFGWYPLLAKKGDVTNFFFYYLIALCHMYFVLLIADVLCHPQLVLHIADSFADSLFSAC